ncbi:MAG TPA: 3,4-dihydroxy-2-butanone-4-phosphate synthase [Conexibacter sp.]|jgi:3,4-dihydroxy 2-butanone 4-phosphate synthase/GTP cyclohydrolase II
MEPEAIQQPAPRASLRALPGGPVADGPNRVARASADVAAGRFVVLVDDAAGEAHVVTSALRLADATLAALNGQVRGVLHVALPSARLAALGLAPLGGDARPGGAASRGAARGRGGGAPRVGAPGGAAAPGCAAAPGAARMYAPVELADAPTGIAGEALVAATVRALADPATGRERFSVPGAVFPLAVDDEGVLACPRSAEAAVDLAAIVGCGEAAVLLRAVDERGAPAGVEAGARLAQRTGAALLSVRELVAYRALHEPMVRRVVDVPLPTAFAQMSAVGYETLRGDVQYVAFGSAARSTTAVRVHVHHKCLASDVFGGVACGCGEQLRAALEAIRRGGEGIVLYAERVAESRLGHLLASDEPAPPADCELAVAHVLLDLGVRSVRLSSNAPFDATRLEALGVRVLASYDSAVSAAARAPHLLEI